MRHLALLAALIALPVPAAAQNAHIITPADGQAMIKDYGARRMAAATPDPSPSALAYDVEAVKLLLAQPGVKRLGIFKGLYNGKETFVLVPLDAQGYMMDGTGTLWMEEGVPLCPPYCF